MLPEGAWRQGGRRREERLVTVKQGLIAAVAVAVSWTLSGRAGAGEESAPPQKPKVAVISGRGSEAGRIVDKDGSVKELTRDQLTFKNTASQRALEANDLRAQKAADEAKRTEDAKKGGDKKAEDGKKVVGAKPGDKATDPKKAGAAAEDAEKRKADEEKKKAEDAEKKKAKAEKAYNDKAYDYSGAAYTPETKKKSIGDIFTDMNKPAKPAAGDTSANSASDSAKK